MAAMAAIALAVIAAGNNNGNSGGSGSSHGGGGCDDKDIGGFSNGGDHREQSTKSRRGRNGSRDSNGKVTMTTTARTMTVAMATAVMVAFLPDRQQSAKRGSRSNGGRDGYSNGNGNGNGNCRQRQQRRGQ
jgi:hypothetical protein